MTLQKLEERVALSEQRVYIAPFFAADREGEEETRIRDRDAWNQHRATARLMRHQVLGYLAPRMYVLDVPDTTSVSGPTPEERIYELAASADATLVLFGRYSIEKNKVRVLLRAVDLPSKTVLVADDGLVCGVDSNGNVWDLK